MRQLLTESVIPALGGGMLGLALAWVGLRTLVALKGGNLPRADEIGIDGNVMVYTLLISLLTGLLFGLAPALHFSAENMHENLKEGSRGASSDRGSHTVRRALVVAELALALTLLTGAGLLVKGFARLENVDPGFDPDHLLTFGVALPTTRYRSDTAQIAFSMRCSPDCANPGDQGRGRHLGAAVQRGLDHGELRGRGLSDAPGRAGSLG